MVDIDSETLFNGAAAVVATIAVLFFVFNVRWDFSPVSKVALVLLFLAAVFAVTQRTDDYQLAFFGYGVVVVSFLGLFFEVVSAFDAPEVVTVAGLLCIAGLLFFVRTRLDEEERLVSGRRATYAVAVVAVLTAAVLLTDVVTGGLAYELQPANHVEYTESHGGEMVVASVVVTNPTPLPERVETPNYQVCAAGDWSEYRPPSEPGHERSVHVSVYVQDSYNEHVGPFGTKAYPAELNVNGANLTDETFPVERTSTCPDDDEGAPYVALFEAEENRYGYRVAA